MKGFEGYSDHYDQEFRLVILKALNDEPTKSLNDSLLTTILRTFAFKRDRDYLRTQLNWLETQARAVKLTEAGTALIATLTERGADHLCMISPISGIKPPSLPR